MVTCEISLDEAHGTCWTLKIDGRSYGIKTYIDRALLEEKPQMVLGYVRDIFDMLERAAGKQATLPIGESSEDDG